MSTNFGNSFGKKRSNYGFKNSSNVSRGRNSNQRGGMGNFLLWSLVGILVILLIVIAIFAVGYYTSGCSEQMDFSDYLFGMDLNLTCGKNDNNGQLGQGSGEAAFLEREAKKEDEVFLIGDQIYNYEEAKCKCDSYDSKLATREQVIDSYNKGADTCLYGWAQGQNAFYTTQKCTWDELQRGPRRDRGKCGMPGVNGGYFANKDIKFGALCYGVRPEGEVVTEKKPFCKKQPFCKRVGDSIKKRDGDNVVPFSGKKWSEFAS
jgi:hypothetical protein